MPVKKIRVFGPAKGVQTAYIDLTLVGIKSGGGAVFESEDDSETYYFEAGEIAELAERGLVLDPTKDPGTSNMWNAIDKVESQLFRTDNKFAQQLLKEAGEAVFKAVAEEERDKPDGATLSADGAE
jgi:hypothetical protein